MYLIRSKGIPFRARDGLGMKSPSRLVGVTGWTPFHQLPSGISAGGNADAEVKVSDKEGECADLLKASDKEAAEYDAKRIAKSAASAKKAHEMIHGKPKAKPAKAAEAKTGEPRK